MINLNIFETVAESFSSCGYVLPDSESWFMSSVWVPWVKHMRFFFVQYIPRIILCIINYIAEIELNTAYSSGDSENFTIWNSGPGSQVCF